MLIISQIQMSFVPKTPKSFGKIYPVNLKSIRFPVSSKHHKRSSRKNFHLLAEPPRHFYGQLNIITPLLLHLRQKAAARKGLSPASRCFLAIMLFAHAALWHKALAHGNSRFNPQNTSPCSAAMRFNSPAKTPHGFGLRFRQQRPTRRPKPGLFHAQTLPNHQNRAKKLFSIKNAQGIKALRPGTLFCKTPHSQLCSIPPKGCFPQSGLKSGRL